MKLDRGRVHQAIGAARHSANEMSMGDGLIHVITAAFDELVTQMEEMTETKRERKDRLRREAWEAKYGATPDEES